MVSLAPSLVALRREVDTRYPTRSRVSDGWIGDASHSHRVSDHNPDDQGIVHALDVTASGIDVDELLRAVIGDERVWYVIYDGVIRSRTYGWTPRAYTGPNPHETHVHVSIRYTGAAENDTTPWLDDAKPRTKGLPVVDLSNVRAQAKADKLRVLPGVKQVQRQLNDRLRLERAHRLKVDGRYGARTRAAMLRYQRSLVRLGARAAKPSGVPNLTDLRRLGRGVFRVRK